MSSRFALSRLGPLKLMTNYAEGLRPENGDPILYRLRDDELLTAHGMMPEGRNMTDPKLIIFKRVE